MSIEMDSSFLQGCFGYHAVNATEVFVAFSVSVLKTFSIFNNGNANYGAIQQTPPIAP
jgi:hypothetical protein